jgi:DNA polymerase I-like protein with 3'-5' exonuclease and polymerase domains
MLYEVDLKNAEARCVDYMANETSMIEAYEQGKDPYKIIGSKIFNVPYEDVSNEPESSGFSVKSQRAVAKECKLAFQYRMGWVTFAERADLPQRIAKRLREQYLNSICPNLRRNYWHWVEENLRAKKALPDLFGKVYKFYGIWGEALLSQACNYPPQSTVGAIMNQWALIPIWEGREGFYSPVELLIQEHDSIKYQIRDKYPIEKQAEITLAIVESLERPLNFQGRSWTIPCEVAVGYNLGRWSEKNPQGLKEVNHKKDLIIQLQEIRK